MWTCKIILLAMPWVAVFCLQCGSLLSSASIWDNIHVENDRPFSSSQVSYSQHLSSDVSARDFWRFYLQTLIFFRWPPDPGMQRLARATMLFEFMAHKFVCVCVVLFIYLFIYLFIFRTAPVAYGSSQARGQIRAASAILHHSHSNARSQSHLRPICSSWAILDP